MNNANNLQHHGVTGMKWGVRRYQNKDGSLTPAGRKRAAKLEEKYKKVTGKKIGEKDNKENTVKKPMKKSIKEMSDDELKTKTDRLTLENNYITQVQKMAELRPEKVSKGKSFVQKVWNDVLEPGVTDVGKQLAKSYMVKFTNKTLNLDDEHKVYTNNKRK